MFSYVFVAYFPQCHMLNLRKGYVSCHYFSPCCMSLSPMSYVELKKCPCRTDDFRGRGPYSPTSQWKSAGAWMGGPHVACLIKKCLCHTSLSCPMSFIRSSPIPCHYNFSSLTCHRYLESAGTIPRVTC